MGGVLFSDGAEEGGGLLSQSSRSWYRFNLVLVPIPCLKVSFSSVGTVNTSDVDQYMQGFY